MTVNEPSEGARPGKLEEEFRGVLRKLHYAMKTEESYIGWYLRYVRWHGMRHPREMGVAGIEAERAKRKKRMPVVRTTEIYTEMARAMRGEITSPLDDL